MHFLYAASTDALACSLVEKIKVAILFPLISLLLGVALLVFLWGVFCFIMSADGDEGRATGKRHMLYGIIGLAIMVSALAILTIAGATFGVSVPSC